MLRADSVTLGKAWRIDPGGLCARHMYNDSSPQSVLLEIALSRSNRPCCQKVRPLRIGESGMCAGAAVGLPWRRLIQVRWSSNCSYLCPGMSSDSSCHSGKLSLLSLPPSRTLTRSHPGAQVPEWHPTLLAPHFPQTHVGCVGSMPMWATVRVPI